MKCNIKLAKTYSPKATSGDIELKILDALSLSAVAYCILKLTVSTN